MKLTFAVKIFILLVIPFSVYSQDVYNGFLQEFYLGRQPSAKAEAIGRGLVSNPEYDFSSWYNPATLGLSGPITVNGSYSGPYYALDSSYYNYLGVSHNTGKYGAIGFSRYFFKEGLTNLLGTNANDDDIKTTLYTINYAVQPIKDLYAGINFNILSIHFPSKEVTYVSPSQTLYPIDIGVLKIFEIQNTKHTVQRVTAGASLYNITNVKYSLSFAHDEQIPVIFRLGASYNFQFTQRKGADELRTINLLGYAEVEDLLNSKYFTMLKAGLEITSLEIFSARLGYFTQNLNNFGVPGNLSEQHQITYGLGLQLPLAKITSGRFPLNIRFDYTSLPQPTYTQLDWKNFNSYSLTLKWENPFYNF